jgi:hypothetical protein
MATPKRPVTFAAAYESQSGLPAAIPQVFLIGGVPIQY